MRGAIDAAPVVATFERDGGAVVLRHLGDGMAFRWEPTEGETGDAVMLGLGEVTQVLRCLQDDRGRT